MSREEMVGLWEEVKANGRKLDGCERHTFEAVDPEKKFGGTHRCINCGGTADTMARHWYERGSRHALEFAALMVEADASQWHPGTGGEEACAVHAAAIRALKPKERRSE